MGQSQMQQEPLKVIQGVGILYEENWLLRTILVQDNNHFDNLTNYLQTRSTDPVFLKIKEYSKHSLSSYCSSQTNLKVLIEYYENDLHKEIRKRRISNNPFSNIDQIVTQLIDGLAFYQKSNIFYKGLSTHTLLYNGNIKLLDPIIFELPEYPPNYYTGPAQGYSQLAWSVGIIIVELSTLQTYDKSEILQLNPYLKYLVDYIQSPEQPNLLELQQHMNNYVPETVQQPLKPQFQLQLQKVPIEPKESLTERIKIIRAEYYSKENKDLPNTTDTFKDYFKNQNVDLKSDPFLLERQSEVSSIKTPFLKADEEYIHEVFIDGAIYEGFKKNGLKSGQGTMYYADGSFYIGQWKNNKIFGYGSLYYPSGNLAYQGFWVDDQFHGKGVMFNDKPDPCDSVNYKNFNFIGNTWKSYTGDFVLDHKDGKGVLLFSSGERYEGQFKDDLIHGNGIFKTTTKDIKGIWNLNLMR